VSVLITGALVLSGLTTALGAITEFSVAAGALLIIGGAQIIFTAGCNTTLQLTAPDRLRGRVMSLYALVFAGASPFGALLVGYLAEKLGVRAACAIGGGTGLLLVALLALVWQRMGRRPHRLPEPTA
jgi:MFS family permease